MSIDGCPVQSSLGLTVHVDGSIHDHSTPSNVFILGGGPLFKRNLGSLLDWIRTHAGAGSRLFGIGDGTSLLLRSGLLANRTIAAHWEKSVSWAAAYRTVETKTELFRRDGEFITCAGNDALLDMMMYGLTHVIGPNATLQIADMLNLKWLRRSEDPQYTLSRDRIDDQTLRRALRIFEEHLTRV